MSTNTFNKNLSILLSRTQRRELERLNKKRNRNRTNVSSPPLLNAKEWKKNHPNYYPIPTDEKKSKIKIGDSVKITDSEDRERFWVIVEEFISDELMIGEVNNYLDENLPYQLGDKIYFTMDNILTVHDEDYDQWVFSSLMETHSNINFILG